MTANNLLTYRFRSIVALNGPGPVTHYMAPQDALALAQDLEAAARDCLGVAWADSTLEQSPPRLAYPVEPRGVGHAQARAADLARAQEGGNP